MVAFITASLGWVHRAPQEPRPEPKRGAPAVERAREAVAHHLRAIRAPGKACVLDAAPTRTDEFRVNVWWPGDDQPTGLPRLLTFRYDVRSARVDDSWD
jgi:hypothetical protein